MRMVHGTLLFCQDMLTDPYRPLSQEPRAISIAGKDSLPAIAARCDVIERLFKLNAHGFAPWRVLTQAQSECQNV